ncbi:MAG TPA: hypothetical protein EYG86_01260 [Crocinitomicaceae bacterium]|nr:hypothetical protein [Crocinitomicaceae bacterium]
MNFNTYLLNKSEAINTIRTRENTVKQFTEWLKYEEKQLQNIGYNELMEYVVYCKQKKNVVHTIRLKIKSLSVYFEYLISEKELKNNPAELVKLKGGIRTIPHNLFTSEQLTEIYELQTSYGLTQKRNKVLLSLVVFQGVGSRELGMIELKDVDLTNGKIYIPGSRTANGRTLDLKVQQLLLFQNYIIDVRPAILKEASKTSNYFLVNQGRGKSLMTNVISVLIRKLRYKYPQLKTLQQIRQSVIAEWLKKEGLRKSQYMAGHRYVSSTERYSVDKMEGLKKSLKMYYVLKK